tara:strand:+ start:262 stop:777 length:516 start_codon:yes stop_codon:yes gene_type:complete
MATENERGRKIEMHMHSNPTFNLGPQSGGGVRQPEIGGPDKVTMIINSGEYQRVSYAISIAKVAAALDMEVHMLFTYKGLERLIKGRSDELGNVTDANFLKKIKDALEKDKISKLSEDLVDANKIGVRIYACVTAMSIMNVKDEELIKEVNQVMGLSQFLELSRGSITYYV